MLVHHSPGGLLWIESAGGPLLLLDRRWLADWHGADRAPNHSSVTDYERACAVSDILGPLAVGPGQGLVLGDEPLSTAWWPMPEAQGGIVARWRWAPNEALVLAALRRLSPEVWVPSSLRVAVPTGQAVLFDAADSGEQCAPSLRLPLSPGIYGVATAEYAPEAEIALLLHRLTLLDAFANTP